MILIVTRGIIESRMYGKTLLIATIAFAFVLTGAGALNSDILLEAGFSEAERYALEEAYEFERNGERKKALHTLSVAGLDVEDLTKLNETIQNYEDGKYSAIEAALTQDDYTTFKELTQSHPVADVVVTQDDFEEFCDAYNFHKEKEGNTLKELIEEMDREVV